MREKGAELASSVAEKAAKVAEGAQSITKIASGLPGAKTPAKKDKGPEVIAWDNDEYRAIPAAQRLFQQEFTAKVKLDEKHSATLKRMHGYTDDKRLIQLQKKRRLAYLHKNEQSVVLCQSVSRRKQARARVEKEKKKQREEAKHKRYVASKAAQAIVPIAYQAWATAHAASAAATRMNELMARLAADAASASYQAWDAAEEARYQAKMQTKAAEYNMDMQWGSDASSSNWVCVKNDAQVEFNDSFHVESIGLQPPNGFIAEPLAECFGTCTKIDWETHFFVRDPERPKQHLTYDKLEPAERPDTAVIRNLPLAWFGVHQPPTNSVNLDTSQMNPMRSAFAAFGKITGFDTEMVAGDGVFGLIEEKRKREEEQRIKEKEEREEQKRLDATAELREQVRSRNSSRGSSRGGSRPGSRPSSRGAPKGKSVGGKAKGKATGRAGMKASAKTKKRPSAGVVPAAGATTSSARGSRGKKLKGKKLGPKIEIMAQAAPEEEKDAKADGEGGVAAKEEGRENADNLEQGRKVQFDNSQSTVEATSATEARSADSPTPDDDPLSMGVLSLFEGDAPANTSDGINDGESIHGEFSVGDFTETATELAERVALAVAWAAEAAVAAATAAVQANTIAAVAAAENMGAGGPFGVGNRGALNGPLLCDVYVQYERYEDFQKCMKAFCCKRILVGVHRGGGGTGSSNESRDEHSLPGGRKPCWYPEATLDTDRYFLGKRILGRQKRRKDLLDLKRLADRKERVKVLRQLKAERKQYDDLIIALVFIDEAFREMRGRPMVNANGVPVNPDTQAYALFYRMLDEGEKLAVEAREQDQANGVGGVSRLKKNVSILQKMRRAADTLFKEECAQVLPSVLWVMHLQKCTKFGQLLKYTYGIDADGVGAFDPHEGSASRAIAPAAGDGSASVVDTGENKHVDYTRSIRRAKVPTAHPRMGKTRTQMPTASVTTDGGGAALGNTGSTDAGATGAYHEHHGSTTRNGMGTAKTGTAGVGGDGGATSMMMSASMSSMPIGSMHPSYGLGDSLAQSYSTGTLRASHQLGASRSARRPAAPKGLSTLHGCTLLVPIDRAFIDSGISTFEPRCWGAHVLEGPYKMEDFYMLDAGRVDTVGMLCQLQCAVNGTGKYVIWVRSEK
jgi:hypothetical protein